MKEKHLGIFRFVATLIALCVLLFSCGPATGVTGKTGSISLSISESLSRDIFSPPISMDITSVEVSGAGPFSATFDATLSILSNSDPVVFSGLVPGDWTVSVVGYNAAGEAIAEASESCAVLPGESTALSMGLGPLSGEASLQATITWTASPEFVSDIEASLTDSAGVVWPRSATVDASSPNYTPTWSGMVPGYYTISVRFLQDGVLLAGRVAIARLAAGHTTLCAFDFPNVENQPGSIAVTIDAYLGDPLPVAIDGVQSSYGLGQSMELRGWVLEDWMNPDPPLYFWYIDSQYAGSGSTIDLTTEDLSIGTHSLDLIVWADGGRRAGSDSAVFYIYGD